MKNLYFDDFGDLACSVADTYDSLIGEDFEDVAIIAKYDEARQIVRDLICIGYDIHSIELHEVDWEGYDAEYVISLYDDKVWCEPMLRENGYLDEYAPVVYVMGNCSSKVIPHCKGKIVYEVTVGEVDCDECECDCWNELDECESTDESVTYTKDDDGNTHGFIVSRSDGNSCYGVSFYSTDKLSMRDIQSLMQECGF